MSKALEKFLSEMNKKFGEGVLVKGSDKPLNIERISTGSPLIDLACGGGLPMGRIVEVYGLESSGKTSLTLNALAQAQKAGHRCAFIDAEHALDIRLCKRYGINVEELYMTQPDNGEQALQICENLIESGLFSYIVVDSVAALIPKSEIDGEIGDQSVGVQARLMSQAMRKLTAAISNQKCCVVFINQVRMKIGTYGNPETTTGGNALKFYSSIRIEVRRQKPINDADGKPIGQNIKVKVVKNKTHTPFLEAETVLHFNEKQNIWGFNPENEMVECALSLGIVDKNGAMYSYPLLSEKTGRAAIRGKDNFVLELKQHQDIYEKLCEAAKEKMENGMMFEPSAEDVSDTNLTEADLED